MKKITNLFACTLFGLAGFSQNTALRVLEYRPAPGQHINVENIGTPQAAQKMAENLNSLVSLGSFGGYVVLGFDQACKNHPDNPYGIDFTVFGNSFSGSSEPGVVWVMQDENQNGLPDDTWYEIAGSQHFHSKTVQNYEVVYFKTDTRDLFWSDNRGQNGLIQANSFNLQEYYPTAQIFPEYPHDSVSFSGTLLSLSIDFSKAQEIKATPPAFGYADSHPRKQGIELFLPDNPYTKEIEGSGGDPIDISWAVDSLGKYVDLDSIHFVKIVSGSLLSAGWLGEISTDVAWVEVVRPNPGITGKENLLVVYPYSPKLILGDSLLLEACYFEKGRKTESVISFSSQNEQVVRAVDSGWLKTVAIGETEVLIGGGQEVETVKIKVVKPDSIQILTDFSSVYPGDTMLLSAQVFDFEQEKLNIPVQFTSSNPAAGIIKKWSGETYFVAQNSGETVITAFTEGFDVRQQVRVRLYSPDDVVRIYFSAKTENENLLPWQWIELGVGGLNGFVENRQSDYAHIEKPTLFHAMVAGLLKADVPFAFKDDDSAGGNLYLHALENDGMFYYGWGGKIEPEAFARAWIARLNNEQFLSGFDKTEISNGDTVALYHVPKITEPWVYSRLLAGPDSAAAGDEIEVQLSQVQCTFSENEITESDFIPVVHAEIKAGNVYYTVNSGKANFRLEAEPPLVISSGNEAVLVSKKLSVGIEQARVKTFRIYPNPVGNELTVEGVRGLYDSKLVFRLITSGGQIVFEQQNAGHVHRFDLRRLPSGIYFLVVIQGKRVETHKIVKK